MSCALRHLPWHFDFDNSFSFIVAFLTDGEVEPSVLFFFPAVEGCDFFVTFPDSGGDETHCIMGVGAESETGSYFAEGGT